MTQKKILLRSSWQTVNIGDIAHTPGVLHILEQHMPEVETCLYGNTGNGVRKILTRRFPNLKIISTEEEFERVCDDYDFYLHGSGPSLLDPKAIEIWRQKTGRPYGIFGISLQSIVDAERDLLNNAEFIYFRDSHSLEFARNNGVVCPVMEFGPDGAFATDIRNDDAAKAFLKNNNLEDGQFMCCIPRYRITPYWLIEDFPYDPKKHARNEEMKEHDHFPLREAIEMVVANTNLKVLICPEDQTQVAIGKEMLYDKLPEDIRKKVVWRDKYWLTDEALSTYIRSAGLFGLEMHSPIMCIGNGIPAVVGRFHEQTTKGFMWRDIALDKWLFDTDDPNDLKKYANTVLDIATNPEKAKSKAMAAKNKVLALHARMADQLKTVLQNR